MRRGGGRVPVVGDRVRELEQAHALGQRGLVRAWPGRIDGEDDARVCHLRSILVRRAVDRGLTISHLVYDALDGGARAVSGIGGLLRLCLCLLSARRGNVLLDACDVAISAPSQLRVRSRGRDADRKVCGGKTGLVWYALGRSSSISLRIAALSAFGSNNPRKSSARLAAEPDADAGDAEGADGEALVLERARGRAGEEECGALSIGGALGCEERLLPVDEPAELGGRRGRERGGHRAGRDGPACTVGVHPWARVADRRLRRRALLAQRAPLHFRRNAEPGRSGDDGPRNPHSLFPAMLLRALLAAAAFAAGAAHAHTGSPRRPHDPGAKRDASARWCGKHVSRGRVRTARMC
jgi:hypothetical protein